MLSQKECFVVKARLCFKNLVFDIRNLFHEKLRRWRRSRVRIMDRYLNEPSVERNVVDAFLSDVSSTSLFLCMLRANDRFDPLTLTK